MFRLLTVPLVVLLLTPALRADPPGSDSDRVAEFVKVLKSDNAAVRKQAALALADLGDKAKAAVPALRELLLDSDKDVQSAAAKALGQIGGDPAAVDVPAVIMKLKQNLAAVELDREAILESRRLLEKRIKLTDDVLDNTKQKMAQLQDEKVRAELDAKLLKDRAESLAARVAELEKALAKALEQPAKPTVPGAKNPPKDNIEGLITKIDDQAGLLTVSLGSDAGLQKGHTLEVFRLNPPKYIGTIRIVEVSPTAAAARFEGKPKEPAVTGDRFASKLVLDK